MFEQKHHFESGEIKTIGNVNIDIASFSVSHDAADPQFYTFEKDQSALPSWQIQAMFRIRCVGS